MTVHTGCEGVRGQCGQQPRSIDMLVLLFHTSEIGHRMRVDICIISIILSQRVLILTFSHLPFSKTDTRNAPVL